MKNHEKGKIQEKLCFIADKILAPSKVKIVEICLHF